MTVIEIIFIAHSHIFWGVAKNITNETHARIRRINVGISYHELFQNVILNGSCELFWFDTLFFCSHNELKKIGRFYMDKNAWIRLFKMKTSKYMSCTYHCHDGNYGTIHSHRHGHFVQGDAIKKNFHVFYTVNGHSCHANISGHTFVIRVIPSVELISIFNLKHLPRFNIAWFNGYLPSMSCQIKCHW